MFALRLVLALALVCLTVSGSPLDVYKKLVTCFKNEVQFFKDFFPFHIPKFSVNGKNFSGEYTNVQLYGLENMKIVPIQISKDSDAVAVIQFDNTFDKIKTSGYLKGKIGTTDYEGPVTGYVKNLNLKGKVSYSNQQVTALDLTVTVKKVSVQFTHQKMPFTTTQTTQFFQDYFVANKNALEQKIIQLINNRIDSPQKLASVEKECSIQT